MVAAGWVPAGTGQSLRPVRARLALMQIMIRPPVPPIKSSRRGARTSPSRTWAPSWPPRQVCFLYPHYGATALPVRPSGFAAARETA